LREGGNSNRGILKKEEELEGEEKENSQIGEEGGRILGIIIMSTAEEERGA